MREAKRGNTDFDDRKAGLRRIRRVNAPLTVATKRVVAVIFPRMRYEIRMRNIKRKTRRRSRNAISDFRNDFRNSDSHNIADSRTTEIRATCARFHAYSNHGNRSIYFRINYFQSESWMFFFLFSFIHRYSHIIDEYNEIVYVAS